MAEPLEIHGVTGKVMVVENANHLHIETPSSSGSNLTPEEARYLADRLYQVADSVAKRAPLPTPLTTKEP